LENDIETPLIPIAALEEDTREMSWRARVLEE